MNNDQSMQLLAARAREGSIEAVNTLLDSSKQYVYAAAFGLLNDNAQALGAVRDTMVYVWKNIGLMNDICFENWILRATYLISDAKLDPNERTSSNTDTDRLMSADKSGNSLMMLPELYASRNVLKERLIGVIFGLSNVLRETLVLYYHHKKTVTEVSEIMGCPEQKTQSRLYLAHESIAAALKEKEKEKNEQFFGKLKGSVSLGAFISYHINRSLPSGQEFEKLLEESRSSAYQAVKTYPEPEPQPAQPPQAPQAPPQAPPAPQPPAAAAPPVRQSSPPAQHNAAPYPVVKKADDRPIYRPAPERQQAPQSSAASEGTGRKKAERSTSPVIALFICASVAAILACLLFVGYKYFSAKSDDVTEAPASVSSQEAVDQATQAPESTAPGAVSTDAVEDVSDDATAYSAYLDVLSENEEAIKNYTWQYKNEDSGSTMLTEPIAFSDVMGDETPEMIYIRSDARKGSDNKICSLHVVTFDGEKAVEASNFRIKDDSAIYCLTKIEDSKDLYLFIVSSSSDPYSAAETVYRFEDNGENTLEVKKYIVYKPAESTGTIDDEEVSSKEAKSAYDDLAEEASELLMSSDSGKNTRYSDILGIDAKNQAMTYISAVSYLTDPENEE